MRDSPVTTSQALEDGARRSREASSVAPPESLPARIWRLHKWKIIALVLFALLDLVFMGGGYIGGHF